MQGAPGPVSTYREGVRRAPHRGRNRISSSRGPDPTQGVVPIPPRVTTRGELGASSEVH